MNTVTQRPYKSSTHNERFYQFTTGAARGTVFFREEVPGSGEYFPSVALCHQNDAFCRKTGRNVARRKYFTNRPGNLLTQTPVEPTTANAVELLTITKNLVTR